MTIIDIKNHKYKFETDKQPWYLGWTVTENNFRTVEMKIIKTAITCNIKQLLFCVDVKSELSINKT